MAVVGSGALVVFAGLILGGCIRKPEGIMPLNPAPVLFPYDEFRAKREAENNPVLIAGAAEVDITPYAEKNPWVAGYGPGKPADRVPGPITARCLYLDDGKNALSLCGVDVVGLFNPTIKAARARLTQSRDREVMIASTHNHASPDTLGLWGDAIMMLVPVSSGVDPNYMARLEREIPLAVLKAQATARPARLYAAQAVVPPGHSANLWWGDYKDDTATLLEARDLQGQVIGTMVNYANHAEVLGPGYQKIAPDWPGHLYARMKEKRGGVTVFLQGAIGGIIVPALHRTRMSADDLTRERYAYLMGAMLADFLIPHLEAAEPLPVAPLAVSFHTIEVPIDNARIKSLAKRGVLAHAQSRAHADANDAEPIWIQTDQHRLNIGGVFDLVTVPGEIFPVMGFHIKDKLMEGRFKAVVGLGNDELGYIMLPEEYDGGFYPYETTVSGGPRVGVAVLDGVAALTGRTGVAYPAAPEIVDGRVRGFTPQNAGMAPLIPIPFPERAAPPSVPP